MVDFPASHVSFFVGVNDMVVFSWSTHHKLLICRSKCAHNKNSFNWRMVIMVRTEKFDVWLFAPRKMNGWNLRDTGPLGRGKSSSKPSFSGSVLIFGGVKKAWVVSNPMDKCAGQRRNLSSNRCEHVSKSLKPALSWISVMIYIQEHALCSVRFFHLKKIMPIYHIYTRQFFPYSESL